MTINEFISKLNKEKVDVWWEQLQPEKVPQKAKDANWKYFLTRADKRVEFKWSLRDLAKFYNLDFNKFNSSTGNRNNFCEAFDFSIQEELIYDNSEQQRFTKQYLNKVSNKVLFQQFITYGYNLINKLNIDAYNVRMAVRPNGDFMVVIGMRAVLNYIEKDNDSYIGFIMSTDVYEKLKINHPLEMNMHFKGDVNKSFVQFKTTDFNEIPEDILRSNQQHASDEFNLVKSTKRARWNVEAKTTNGMLKYLMFKNQNVETAIKKSENSIKDIDLPKLLRKKFGSIWRCADSYKWHILKNHDLLTFDWLNDSIDYKSIDIKKLKSGKRAIEPWVNKMKTGDLVFIMGKNHYNGIAIINSEYSYQENQIDMGSNGIKPSVKITYIHKLENPINHGLKTHNNPTTFAKLDAYSFSLEKTINMLKEQAPSAYEALLSLVSNESDVNNTNSTKGAKKNNGKLNQILYGPPGTGKTYQTITKAVAIITPDFYEKNKNNREALVEKFKELTISNWSDTKGQIAFCTFHQSFTYEDFVEGIKPKVVNDKDIIYEVDKGIFKAICDRARTATNNSIDFDTVINKLQNRILDEGSISLTTDRGNIFDVNYTGKTTFRIRPHESTVENPQYPASIENIRMLYEGAPLTDLYNPSYVKGILEYLYHEFDLPLYEEVKDNDKPYVIIIDEINRGNVASIFGELITLIEPDKRSGEEEELSVILPYSKKEFKVPSNVYIMGTMNTADRSVEALDSALRRRFSFEEVMPNHTVIAEVLNDNDKWEGTTISAILKKINKRVTRLIDRDHQIGHSYFLKIESLETSEITNALKNIFSENIIPLLQEYFFNDFNKLGLVLGDGFLTKDEDDENIFARFSEGDDGDYTDAVYEIMDPKGMTDEVFVKAIKGLLN